MLTAEQYKWLHEQKRSLEARIDELRAEIEADRRKAEQALAAAAGSDERSAFFDRPELRTGAAEGVEYARQQRDHFRLLASGMRQQAKEIQALIETKRAEIRLCQERLRIFSAGGIKSEIAAYERAHG